MSIDHTRNMVRAALSGALADVPYEVDQIFGVEVPTSVPGVPPKVLRPRGTWADPDAYDAKARELASMFTDNFAAYADGVSDEVRAAGPRIE
jgi:phosphoenolpyruvate carboxykinase (ATP)